VYSPQALPFRAGHREAIKKNGIAKRFYRLIFCQKCQHIDTLSVVSSRITGDGLKTGSSPIWFEKRVKNSRGQPPTLKLRRAKGVKCLLSNDFSIVLSIFATFAMFKGMSVAALRICNVKLNLSSSNKWYGYCLLNKLQY